MLVTVALVVAKILVVLMSGRIQAKLVQDFIIIMNCKGHIKFEKDFRTNTIFPL